MYKFKKYNSQTRFSTLRKHFSRYGITKEFSTKGQRTLYSAEMENFLTRWGVSHHVSSFNHLSSKKHMEVVVKQAQWLIVGNLGPWGMLNTDKMARALL